MGDDMGAVLVGAIVAGIYATGVFMGIWIGRGESSRNTNNWRGAVPKSRKAPPKPPHNPHK